MGEGVLSPNLYSQSAAVWFLRARCQCAPILQAAGTKASLYQGGGTRITPLMCVEVWCCSDKDSVNIYTDRQSHGNFTLLA